ncbi:132_t:CDS:2 [Ambispora leptoticha]|uniref:132_t:CDS:1 n=1 Tax=Ambispora leptoticha TaxID=144679 RepID=A0A9N8Z4E0_9GLOM|nr:132_t:CDS:2 [Ambispora leptoticha]
MSNLSTPQRKQSNAGGHQGELPENVSSRGAKREHEDDDSEGDEDETKSEKRAGRRKIKIEYIDDKSRRHITFSKRKAGIMKKAYELSTLTGTQVLLLVVSETGLVYTFTTPKLQPLVTKPEGKNLIQTCLNAPDNPSTTDTAPTPTRQAQTPPVYGNDSSSPLESSADNIYDNERKHPSTSGQLANTPTHNYATAQQQAVTAQQQQLNMGYTNQYPSLTGNLPMNTGLPNNYMPPQYQPQHNQQYLGQYSQNASYMQSNYWNPNGGNGSGKVQQFPNQSPEKK